MSNRPLNVGLVGGGKGAFIVHPHQKAIHFDGTRRVVAGALFPDPKIALEEAANWPYPIKGYGSYDEMIAANAALPADQKLDYILIVTPNFVHYDPAMKAMKAGIAVFCEKPLCLNLKEATDLVKTSHKLNVPFGVAHTYLGHWTSRFSPLHCPQPACSATSAGWTAITSRAGWRPSSRPPASPRPLACGSQARWRLRLRRRYRHARAHAAPLCHGPGNRANSPPNWRLRSGPAARRPLHHLLQSQQRRTRLVRASQICIGPKTTWASNSSARKAPWFGARKTPESLVIRLPASQTASTGAALWRPGDGFIPKDIPAELLAEPTIPAGHPEAFHDAFARLHRSFEADVRRWKAGEKFNSDGSKYANVEDGWTGLAFIETAVKSSASKGKWTKFPKL